MFTLLPKNMTPDIHSTEMRQIPRKADTCKDAHGCPVHDGQKLHTSLQSGMGPGITVCSCNGICRAMKKAKPCYPQQHRWVSVMTQSKGSTCHVTPSMKQSMVKAVTGVMAGVTDWEGREGTSGDWRFYGLIWWWHYMYVDVPQGE